MASSTPLSKANTTFSLDLLKKLSDEDKTGNLFYSPFSISSALAMVMLGARDNTATQMSEVLCFPEAEQPKQAEEQTDKQTETKAETEAQMQMDMEEQTEEPGPTPKQAKMKPQLLMRRQMRTQIQHSSRLPDYLRKCLKTDVHDSFAKLLNELNKADAPYALSLANRLYGEQSYQFVKDFLAETKKHYNAELESVDFKSSAEAARVNINSWVEKQTEEKIKDILGKGVVNDKTKLVLVNAIYFKGTWNKQFEEDSTVDAQFKINKNDTKPVKMMCQESKFPLTSIPEANCQILEMPYKGNDLSMLIFLPNDMEDNTTGLEKLEMELTYEKFMKWTRKNKVQTKVEVKLPRFKMEEKYDMGKVLKAMGMVDAFDDTKSDFSGMSPSNDLVLSKVVHKAFVEVNEEGTEAAAATAVTISVTSFSPSTPFIADHPFLFFIRHNPSMSIVFAGRYSSPE